MDALVVESRAAFIAALRAVARPSYEEARQHPFTVSIAGTRCIYRFPAGVTERDADFLARRIRKTPANAFTPNH